MRKQRSEIEQIKTTPSLMEICISTAWGRYQRYSPEIPKFVLTIILKYQNI